EKNQGPPCLVLRHIHRNCELSAGVGLNGRGFVCLLHGGLGGLKAHLRVCTVAEGFVDRSTAAAERKRHLTGQVVLVAVCVHQFNGALGSLHAIGPVSATRNLNLRHVSPPLCPARGAVVSIVAEFGIHDRDHGRCAYVNL